ncbi:MAG: TIGR02302 family protein [Alphaproteobacteria bacterium]
MRSDLDPIQQSEGDVSRHIARATFRAQLALGWEDIWPRIVPVLIVVGTFVLVSWLGLWSGLPDWLRYAFLSAFAIGGLLSLAPLFGLRLPDRRTARARLERDSDRPHRPATSFLDRLAGTEADGQTKAIWEAHRARLVANFSELRAGTPSPGLASLDPFGLRYLLLLLLVVTFVATGGGVDRIADAFRGAAAAAPADQIAARVDAWAEPPAYTQRPSIFLTGNTAREDGEAIIVPAGTEVFVRIAGDSSNTLSVRQTAGSDIPTENQGLGDGPREFTVVLTGDGRISVVDAGSEIEAWTFSVIPDLPPEIELIAGPERANGGGLQVGYRFQDDYGVVESRGEIALTTVSDDAQPLVGAPDYILTIPRSEIRDGEATTARDVSEHPWAGLVVDVTLIAADAAGQEGRSETHRATLPGRVFANPLALALVAERQTLALDAHMAGVVATALDQLASSSPHDTSLTGFLAIRSAYYRLVLADDEDELRGVVDYLWDIAIALEGNPVVDALAALEDAAEALREALDRGAADHEIAALMDNLREAMAEYLQAAAANTEPRRAQPALDVDTRILRPDELEGMLDQLENLAEIGATEAAEELLEQMRQLMQNLATDRIPEDLAREFQPGGEQLDDLGYLMQEQQRLLDETFALQQDQNTPLPVPRTDEETDQLMEQLRQMRADQEARGGELRQQQRTLEVQAQQLIQRLAEDGLDPLDLPGAARNMAEAGDRIDEGRPGMAVQNQLEALDQMRALAEALAEQVAAGLGIPAGDEGAQDPLGRPPPDMQGQRFGDNVEVPDEIERQLARQILDAIRQRLEELGRPQIERDYLERLIDTY